MAHDCLHDSHIRMSRVEATPGHHRCLLWSSIRIGSSPQRAGDTSLIVTAGPTGVCVESRSETRGAETRRVWRCKMVQASRSGPGRHPWVG